MKHEWINRENLQERSEPNENSKCVLGRKHIEQILLYRLSFKVSPHKSKVPTNSNNTVGEVDKEVADEYISAVVLLSSVVKDDGQGELVQVVASAQHPRQHRPFGFEQGYGF